MSYKFQKSSFPSISIKEAVQPRLAAIVARRVNGAVVLALQYVNDGCPKGANGVYQGRFPHIQAAPLKIIKN